MLEDSSQVELDIYNLIVDHPGCYLRSIKNKLGISMGSVQYHLDRLEKTGVISSSKRFYKSYFPASIKDGLDKKILEVLSHERTREILLLIIEYKSPTQTQLSKIIGLSQTSVSWHCQRLLETKIIEEIKDGKYRRYQIIGGNKECKRIMDLMKSYLPSIWNQWSDRLLELFFP